MTSVHFVSFALSRRGGGLSPALQGLASGLQANGDSVSVAGLADPDLLRDRDSWPVSSLRGYEAWGPVRLGWSPLMWWQARTGGRPGDIVHAHGIWSWPLAAATISAKRHQRPLIISPHGMLDPWILARGKWQKRMAWWWWVRTAGLTASVVHALSLSEAKAVQSFWPSARIAIIPNGVQLPAMNMTPLKRPWPDDGRLTVLFLGRLHPKKGLLELISALSLVYADDCKVAKKIRVVIAGWGDESYSHQVREGVTSAGLGDALIFLGEVFGEAKKAALRHADAFILPSHGEGLPVAALEAASYGLPLLLTEACNLPEFFEAEAAMRITNDPISLAGSLREFVALPAPERRRMGERAFAVAKDKFTWNSVAKRMSAVYAWVLGKGPEPACIWHG